jgi:hypothetical protein
LSRWLRLTILLLMFFKRWYLLENQRVQWSLHPGVLS